MLWAAVIDGPGFYLFLYARVLGNEEALALNRLTQERRWGEIYM